MTNRLSDQDLNRPLPNGWSVATKLAHLAFWDRYYYSLLEEWEQKGFAPSPAAVDAINDAVRVLTSTIPPRSVVQLVQDAAEAIDRKLSEIPGELAAALESGGYRRVLCRALHRREHLDQIEKALSA